MLKFFLITVLTIFSLQAKSDEIINIKYENWEIDYNCDHKGYEYFHYTTVPDSGNEKRHEPFHKSKKIPKRCQQLSTKSYWIPNKPKQVYDRGHGVHQNIWDHDKSIMKLSNYMDNILPHASKLNRRGVWRKTEELTECYRDHGTVEVWGGVLWGNDKSNDHFIKSHGVTTPDYLWKVIKFPNGEVNAWLMPNDDTPTGSKMNSYLVSPAKLENLTGYKFDISRSQRSEKDSYGVNKPKYCSLK